MKDFNRAIQREREDLQFDEQTRLEIGRQVSKRDTDPLRVYNPRDVAELLQCSVPTARNYMRDGTIPSYQVGIHWFTVDYVLESVYKTVDNLIKNRTITPRQLLPIIRRAKKQ